MIDSDTLNDPAIAELFAVETERKAKLTREQERRADRLRLAAQNLLNHPDGKLLLFRLIEMTGVFASSFTGNSTTFFNEGRRSVGLDLYRLLMTADPLALQKLVEFRREELKQEEGQHVSTF